MHALVALAMGGWGRSNLRGGCDFGGPDPHIKIFCQYYSEETGCCHLSDRVRGNRCGRHSCEPFVLAVITKILTQGPDISPVLCLEAPLVDLHSPHPGMGRCLR